ncbi:RagB/SusD family nutrient uptake outer membrane protein [Algoriphagus sp. Y33]|uniref:RagB/SusD family nutrient uptake outer membrane protein n=1 Tax=Algoriphagus sp. Y33 TaxID=2772483 RepID=UPI001780EA34|nr:RagB/SusD family nutrient uptake outer membrane protein [Algoriphagus sp. Y33]
MKNILSYILVGSVIALGSCSDFMGKNPTDQLSSELFWKSRADFDNALTAIYGAMQSEYYAAGAPNWDAVTDNGYGQHNYYGSNGIVQGNIFPSSGGYISDIYISSYQAIARINIFLENLEEYEGSDMTGSNKEQLAAEAKFIRGFFYFQLYQAYGAVPVVTVPLDFETQFQAKSPKSEVFAQLVADLETAIASLPDTPYYSGGGHAVKTSAQALLLRAYMFDAFDSKNTPNVEIMSKANILSDELVNSNYKLAEDFTSVFRAGSQEGNEEIIFSIKFLAPNNSTAMDQWYGDWVVVSPLQSFVDEFEEGDQRLSQSIYTDYVDWGDGNIHSPSNNRPTGYGVKKFLTPDLIPYGYATRSEQDWVLLRYADVLLMHAEIENELYGPSEEVYSAVNAIRNRSGLDNLPSGLSKEQMRDIIRHERRIEIAFEGLRYYDLKRWKIAGEILNNVEDGVIPFNFEDKFYEWPLPQSEIDKSNGVLIQNENY